jgi:hypothetical protein
MQTNYVGSDQPPGTPFDADRPVGIIVILMHVCCMFIGIGLAGLLSAVGLGIGAQAQPGPETAVLGVTFAAIGFLLFGLSCLGVICGWGIFKSRKWGFWIGVIVFGMATMADLSGGATAAGAILHVGAFIYCLLRLIGKLGPLPQ